MKSNFFYGDACVQTAQKVTDAINGEPDFLSALTADSPRAVGDAIQSLIEQKFEKAIGDWCVEYSASFARRAMADLAFTDKEGFHCVVDVKTHRVNASFSMPALVSVQRLARFYEDDKNIFAIMMVKYETIGTQVRVQETIFCPIEFFHWECLTIGALGWGQIQIANSNAITLEHGQSRKTWMLAFCAAMQVFYPREIAKIEGRIARFDEVKSHWENKPDIWT